MKSRIMILFVGIIALWAMLILRGAYLQIIPNEKLTNLHEKQFQTVITLQNRRGAIVDRGGRELALSTTAFSLYADPKIIEKRKSVAKKLSSVLGQSPESIFAKIKNKEKRFVWISRQLNKEKADQIKSWDIRGLAFVEEFRRVYPNEQILASVLGFIGREGQGLEGLELYFDKELQGNKKKVSVRRDARGRPLVADGMMFAENPDGSEIKLTVDLEIQHALENELVRAVQEFEAEQAYAVILDAKTSAVLAMAGAPSFDANEALSTKPELRRNKAVTDSFEPGSTMKTFAIASALKEKIAKPNTRYSTENGVLKVGDRVIREAELDHRWPNLTVSEILAYSSNIGTTKIAFQLGDDKLRQTLLDFGFGAKTGISLPGEAKGTVQPLPWNQHLLSNISFGHGITATPLQIANAYAAIANGGLLNEPYLVHSVRNLETGEVETREEKKNIRRVLTEEDAAQLRIMLTGATANGGTGVNARVNDFIVGGKTGTAQKVDPNGRGYLKGAYISSFAGFIPATQPKYVIYVAVDHPKKKNAYYGSAVAAPIFSRVASYVVRKEGLAPVLLSEKNLVPTRSFATQEKRNIASTGQVRKDKKNVQTLAANIENKSSVLTADQIMSNEGSIAPTVMPELQTLGIREVIKRLKGTPNEVKFIGSGSVSSTWPTAGEPIPEGSKIIIYLENR